MIRADHFDQGYDHPSINEGLADFFLFFNGELYDFADTHSITNVQNHLEFFSEFWD